MRRILFVLAALVWAALGRADPVTLRVQTWDGDVGLEILRQACRDFERLNPGVRVVVENITDYRAYHQKLLVQLAGNTAPDVVREDAANFQALARRGALLPLDRFAAASGVSLTDYYPAIIRVFTLGGKLYVLPRDIAPFAFVYYNKRAFDEAGLPYPDGSWTWDERERPELGPKDFLWTLRRLTRPGRYGFVTAWPQLLPLSLAIGSGGRVADDYANPTRITLDSPENVRAYALASDLWFGKRWVASASEVSTVQQSSVNQMFAAGKVAMMGSGLWEAASLRRMIGPNDFEWDVTLFPRFARAKRATYMTGGSGYAIFRTTRHPREAWTLVRFLSGEQGQRLAIRGDLQPALIALSRSREWSRPDVPPRNRRVSDAAARAVQFEPSDADLASAMGRAGAQLDRIVSGSSRDARRVLAAAQADAEAQLARLREERSGAPFLWSVAGVAIGGVVFGGAVWVWWPHRREQRGREARRENRAAYLFLSPWIAGLLIFGLGPILASFAMSLADWDAISPARWRGSGNYVEAISRDEMFGISLRVTAVYTAAAVPLGLAAALGVAVLLNQRVRGVPLFRAIYYLPTLASGVAAALLWRRVFSPETGLLNAVVYGPPGRLLGLAALAERISPGARVNWLGDERTALAALVMMSLWGVGGGSIILLAALQGVPEQYHEAATLDGAGPWRRFRRITLPLISPTIFFCFVTGVIGSFQVFTQAYVMTGGGPNNATYAYMLYLYEAAFGSLRLGYASALAWVLFVIVLLFTLAQFAFARRWVHYEADLR